ncbi:MAG: hypothetical protein K2X00_12210 [Nitrospiraceae bacterium]|nr:hypothetical protein [Nitrospiraceae bacterium]
MSVGKIAFGVFATAVGVAFGLALGASLGGTIAIIFWICVVVAILSAWVAIAAM